MSDAPTLECPNCKRLEARIEVLEARLEALETENARLRKDSSNSHKPPSSDIVKPPPPAPRRGYSASVAAVTASSAGVPQREPASASYFKSTDSMATSGRGLRHWKEKSAA